MKNPSMTSFLIAFLLAAAVCSNGKAEEVKDLYGDPVRVRAKYFILAVETARHQGGYLVPDDIKTHPICPLGIVQTDSTYGVGVPVSFEYPPIIGRDTIDTSSNINIEFRPVIWSACTDFSKLWAVDQPAFSPVKLAVIIGGDRMNRNSTFKIEKTTTADIYKFTTSYGTVGTIPGIWTNARQVIVSNDESLTLFVVFRKAYDGATSTTSRVGKLGLRMFPFNIM